MWEVNCPSTYYEILWSRLRKNHNWWCWLKVSWFNVAEGTNRICWSRTRSVRNNYQRKFDLWKGKCDLRRNNWGIKKGWSLWFYKRVIRWTRYICWSWRKSTIRRSKTKNRYSKSLIKKPANLTVRWSNFSTR